MKNLLTDCNVLIIVGLLALLTETLIIAIFLTLIGIKRKINEMLRVTFFLLKKDEKYNNSHDSIKRALEIINNNIGSLSSSTSETYEKLIAMVKQPVVKPILPTPDKARMIRETILENINIEVLLSKNMRIQNPQSIIHIVTNTIKVYPEIDKEFLVKLCLAVIENFMLSLDDTKKE